MTWACEQAPSVVSCWSTLRSRACSQVYNHRDTMVFVKSWLREIKAHARNFERFNDWKTLYEVTLHEDDVSVTAILCLLCKTSILRQGIDGLGKVGLQIFDNLLHYNHLINGSSMISQLARQSDQGTYLSFDSCVALLNTSFSEFFFFISLLPQLVSTLFYRLLITLDMSSRKIGCDMQVYRSFSTQRIALIL